MLLSVGTRKTNWQMDYGGWPGAPPIAHSAMRLHRPWAQSKLATAPFNSPLINLAALPGPRPAHPKLGAPSSRPHLGAKVRLAPPLPPPKNRKGPRSRGPKIAAAKRPSSLPKAGAEPQAQRLDCLPEPRNVPLRCPRQKSFVKNPSKSACQVPRTSKIPLTHTN
jgi:hypothetical protein